MPLPLFPSYRYHRTLPPVVVGSAAEAVALGPDWADTPAAFHAPGPDGVPYADVPTADAAVDPRPLELYATRAAEVVATVMSATDATLLEQVQRWEAANPKGARKSVLNALAARLTALNG